MPNAFAHRLGAGVAMAGAAAYIESQEGEITANTLLSGIGGALFGTIPDLLEPALHPNHRKFFHSFVALGLAAYGMKKLYDWQPESDEMRFWRGVALVAGGAFCVHLVMDSFTKRSLPLI